MLHVIPIRVFMEHIAHQLIEEEIINVFARHIGHEIDVNVCNTIYCNFSVTNFFFTKNAVLFLLFLLYYLTIDITRAIVNIRQK